MHLISIVFFSLLFPVFFFNDTATTEIYTLSLHDALPISPAAPAIRASSAPRPPLTTWRPSPAPAWRDRKSTRLNPSHTVISYAVFCLKKKKVPAARDRRNRHVPCAPIRADTTPGL